MAVAYADSGTPSDVAGNVNLTPTAPAAVDAGDTLLCWIGHTNITAQASATYTPPSGWTKVQELQQSNHRQFVYQKDTVNGSEDGATFTWTVTSGDATAGHTAIIHRFNGGSGAAVEAVSSSQSTSTTPSDAGVTTPGANYLAINLLSQPSQFLGSAFTGESGGTWSLVYSYSTSAPRTMLHTATMASAGTIDGGSTTVGGSVSWCSFGGALAPVSAAPNRDGAVPFVGVNGPLIGTKVW